MMVVRARIEDRVLHIELNRPEKRNAIDYATLARLLQLLPTGGTRDVIGVVLSGQGKHFSAGADLTVLTGTVKDRAFDDEMERVIERIDTSPVPVLAAIAGSCIGAAVDLVMACDMRIADHSAAFRVPAVHLGLLYNPSAIARMHRAIPSGVLHRLLVLGSRLDASEATSGGLVTLLTDRDPRRRAHQLLTEGADRDSDAVAQTRDLLRTLSREEAIDPEYWNRVRRQLLESPSRFQRVSEAQKRKDRINETSR